MPFVPSVQAVMYSVQALPCRLPLTATPKQPTARLCSRAPGIHTRLHRRAQTMAAAGLADLDVLVLDIGRSPTRSTRSPTTSMPTGTVQPSPSIVMPFRTNTHVRDLMARDVKAPYLKALQGHLWQQGYESSQLKAPIFPDVAPFIAAAHNAGKRIVIYSSGSVAAQKLFFAHTTSEPSDLTPFISAWFDTVNAGPKTEATSHTTILSSDPTIPAPRWLFLSDNLEEVSAALDSGMRSLPVTRPGNPPLQSSNPLSRIAIPDFSPESTETIRACLTALGELTNPC